MLDLPKGTNLAFHALVVLAKRPVETLAIARVADSLGASPSYMAHLFQQLVRSGLIVSHRGGGGGYTLARSANEITLWDVILALGAKDPGQTPPLPDCPTCPLSSACPIKNGLKSAAERAAEVFQEVTVAGLATLHGEALGTQPSLESVLTSGISKTRDDSLSVQTCPDAGAV